MSRSGKEDIMADEKPQSDAPQATSHPEGEKPDPNVKPPRPVWISKSYKPGKTTGADGGGDRRTDDK